MLRHIAHYGAFRMFRRLKAASSTTWKIARR